MPYSSIKMIAQAIFLVGLSGIYSPSQGMEKENDGPLYPHTPSQWVGEENDGSLEYSYTPSQGVGEENDGPLEYPHTPFQGVGEENSYDPSENISSYPPYFSSYHPFNQASPPIVVHEFDETMQLLLSEDDNVPPVVYPQAQGVEEESNEIPSSIGPSQPPRTFNFHNFYQANGVQLSQNTNKAPSENTSKAKMPQEQTKEIKAVLVDLDEAEWFDGKSNNNSRKRKRSEVYEDNETTTNLVIGGYYNPNTIQENEESIVNLLKQHASSPHLTSLTFLPGEMANDPSKIIEGVSGIKKLRKIVFSGSFPRLTVIKNPRIDFYKSLSLLTDLKHLTHLEIPTGQDTAFLFKSVLKPLANKLEVLVFHENVKNMSDWGTRGRIRFPTFLALKELGFSLCGGEVGYGPLWKSLAKGTRTLEKVKIGCTNPGENNFKIDFLFSHLQTLFFKNPIKTLRLWRLSLPDQDLFPETIESLDLRESVGGHNFQTPRLPKLRKLHISHGDTKIKDILCRRVFKNVSELIIHIPPHLDLVTINYEKLQNLKNLCLSFEEGKSGLTFSFNVQKLLGLKWLENLTFKVNQTETAEAILTEAKNIFGSILTLQHITIKVGKGKAIQDCTSLFKSACEIEAVLKFPEKYLVEIGIDRPLPQINLPSAEGLDRIIRELNYIHNNL